MTINLPKPFKTSDGMHTFHAQPDDRGGVWMNIDGKGPSVGLHYKDVERLRAFLAQLPVPESYQDERRRRISELNQPPGTTVTVEGESGWTTEWTRP